MPGKLVSRRQLLSMTAAFGMSVGLVAAGSATSIAAQHQPIELEFVVWNYSIDTIQDNINKFEELNPGITIKLTDYAWGDYHDTMVLRFRSNMPDIVYSGEDWLPEWASAGWLAPLESIIPAAARYREKTAR